MKKNIWPLDDSRYVYLYYICKDHTVPHMKTGDRYYVRITTVETEFITEWRGHAKQIDCNIRSWYARGAEAVEVQLQSI